MNNITKNKNSFNFTRIILSFILIIRTNNSLYIVKKEKCNCMYKFIFKFPFHHHDIVDRYFAIDKDKLIVRRDA